MQLPIVQLLCFTIRVAKSVGNAISDISAAADARKLAQEFEKARYANNRPEVLALRRKQEQEERAKPKFAVIGRPGYATICSMCGGVFTFDQDTCANCGAARVVGKLVLDSSCRGCGSSSFLGKVCLKCFRKRGSYFEFRSR